MHTKLAEEIVKICRKRYADGDHPTVGTPTTEKLEDCVMTLADQNEVMRKALKLAKPILGAAASDPSLSSEMRNMRRSIYEKVCDALTQAL